MRDAVLFAAALIAVATAVRILQHACINIEVPDSGLNNRIRFYFGAYIKSYNRKVF